VPTNSQNSRELVAVRRAGHDNGVQAESNGDDST